MNIPTVEESIQRMKVEILSHILRKIIPDTVQCFADLHDYVDANEFGGFCDDELADAMVIHYGGRDTHEGMPEAMLEHINAAQDAITEWIESGEMHKTLAQRNA